MKQFYFLTIFFITGFLYAQTTVTYPQRGGNYDAFFTDGGGNYDDGADQLGMWANGSGAMQSVAWRSFTETGLPGGTASTMVVGDSFTITVSATQASYGQIGVSLLSSPTTLSWDDRQSNYAVQVNLNGNGGANDPWEVVSAGGTIDASAIGGSTSYADFKIKFTLDTATTMTVDINDGAATFNVTLNNQDITGYSVYIADDWNGAVNANIYWKPTTEYTYAMTLSNEEFDLNTSAFSIYPNPAQNTISINSDINKLSIYSISGKLIKEYNGDLTKGTLFDISQLSKGLFIINLTHNSGVNSTTKLIKL